MMNKEDENGIITYLLEDNKEMKRKLAKLENQKKYKGVNNKLSNYAQKTIEDSEGPLKPEELQKLLTDDAFNKNNKAALAVIRKYSDDVDGVIQQMLSVYDNVETHMIYRKQQKDLDTKLIKKIIKMSKFVEEEQEKENKPDFKKQSTLDQYFNKENDKSKNGNRKKSPQLKVLEVSNTSKNSITVKQGARASRKRKSKTNDEISSSQESGVTHISKRFSKRLKISSPVNSPESNHSLELMSVEEYIQLTEPMSVASTESSQSSTEPMSFENSEGLSCQSSMSVDDLEETIIKKKSVKKLKGKVPEEMEPRLGRSVPNCDKNEETVPERQFHLRSDKN